MCGVEANRPLSMKPTHNCLAYGWEVKNKSEIPEWKMAGLGNFILNGVYSRSQKRTISENCIQLFVLCWRKSAAIFLCTSGYTYTQII